MSWKIVGKAFVATVVVAALAVPCQAGGLFRGRHGSCCAPACGDCGGCAAPCAPSCAPTYSTQKVMVTEWKPEQYEATRTVYKTEWKEEAYTYYTCERIAQKMTRTVNYTESVPETR